VIGSGINCVSFDAATEDEILFTTAVYHRKVTFNQISTTWFKKTKPSLDHFYEIIIFAG